MAVLTSSHADPRVVVVTDESGAAVAGAVVTEQAMSMSGQPSTTDQNGRALSQAVAGAKWLRVSKAGYTTAIVELPKTFPASVILKKPRGEASP